MGGNYEAIYQIEITVIGWKLDVLLKWYSNWFEKFQKSYY
jgi:hypothetical protein